MKLTERLGEMNAQRDDRSLISRAVAFKPSDLSVDTLDRAAITGVVLIAALVFVVGLPALVIPVLLIGLAAAVFVPVEIWMSAAISLSVFSGQSSLMGLPFPPDRILFAMSIGMLIIGAPLNSGRRRVVKLQPVHVFMVLAMTYAALSAFAAGRLFEERALFQLIDRFGVVPFLLFTLGPIVYGTEKSRRVLLSFLTGTGFYLGVTAWLEALDLRAYTWPSYINDPTVGLHFERARGPFVEGSGMGTGLFVCAVAAMIGVSYFKTSSARFFAKFVSVLCVAGTVFTVTRSVWLGTAIAIIVTMASEPKLRKRLVPLAAVAVAGVVIALVAIPSLSEVADKRANQQETVWDRVNLNEGALNAFESSPLTGIGFGNWVHESADFLVQQPEFPITGTGFEIHALLLSHLAQLGLIGLALFLGALGFAVFTPILSRPEPWQRPWRLGLIAISIQWLVVVFLTPGTFQFATTVLWLFAGICSQNQVTVIRQQRRRRVAFDSTVSA